MVYWNIWIENTLHAYVLGEHTSMKKELYIVYRPLLKVRGLSIEPRFSTMCIDLSIHVHVVKDKSVINLYNHGIIKINKV